MKLELQFGMLLRAKKKLKTRERLFSNPSVKYIEKDTVVVIAHGGTRRGDVICKAIGKFHGEVFEPLPNLSEDFFHEGHKSRHPYDIGLVDLGCWEMVGHLKGDWFTFFQRQAPCTTNKPLVITHQDGEFKFVVGSWDGWSLVPPQTDLGITGFYSSFRVDDGTLGTENCHLIQEYLDNKYKDKFLVCSLEHISVNARADLVYSLGWGRDRILEDEHILIIDTSDQVTVERWFQRLPFDFEI